MKKDKLFVGIDLGTTYCSVAYLEPSGAPVIEKNMDGEEDTPSAVFFRPQGGFEVGTGAKGKSEVFPENTITQVKRKMGKDVVYNVHDQNYTPVQISAMIIRKLVEDFAKTRGQTVTDAVVTIPATFGEAAREATKTAAQIAGIKNVTLLNEPVAAAVSYGYGARDGGHKRILVYDFGGGTLDVTILDVNASEFTTIAMDGNPALGGIDFDQELRRIICEKIAVGTGTDSDLLDSDPYLMSDLDVRSERLKIRLSSCEVATDTINLNNGTRFTFEVTREEFENATRHMIDETLVCIDRVLAAARCTMDEINTVVLVGGSSRIPMVHQAISTRYPRARIELYDTLHAVAKGAALYAGRDVSEPSGTNILSKTFGIKVGNDSTGYRISNIIHRNSLLPVTSTGRFRPQEEGQLKVILEIYESNAFESDKHTDISDADPVGKFELELPEAVSVDTPIMVQFTASAEGILTAVAECGSHKTRYTLDTPVSLSEEEMKASEKMVQGLAEPEKR